MMKPPDMKVTENMFDKYPPEAEKGWSYVIDV
jgi:hypothetical protein